jgi:hypothetical protein
LIRLPISLSQSFSGSGSQGVTGNAYAMLGMMHCGIYNVYGLPGGGV